MARIALFRDANTRPSIPTEPLTPQEWASFGTALGESQKAQIPEHLRFHNPGWNLSLLKTLAQKRWEEQGGEGELGEPGQIDTSVPTESENTAVKTGTHADHEETLFSGIGAANILPEGRMRKKAKLDYSMFMPPQDLDGEDDGRRGRGQHKSFGTLAGGDMDKGIGRHPMDYTVSGSDGTSDLLPRAPYSGKKRGRPPRNVRDDTESESEIGGSPQSEGTLAGSALPKMGIFLEPVADIQNERRMALIHAGSKLHGINLSKQAPGAKDKPSAVLRTNDQALPPDSMKSGPSYRRKQSAPMEEKLRSDEVLASLTISSSPPMPDDGGSSPTSSGYESVSSANQDTTFPAGQLRLIDLPREVANTIPRNVEYFSRRDHVGPLIGGNFRAVVATTVPRPNAPIQTRGYMAIQPAWNPHAPKKAGENGSMMQLSNTSTDPISKTQENFPLFVARGSNQWEYCGQYTVAEVVKLNAFENWMHLSTAGSKILSHWGEEILQKKYEWAKVLFTKNCGWTEEKWDKATVEDFMGPILAGRVPMHWVHLQCVGFDLMFYEALLKQKLKHESAGLRHPIR